MGHILQSPKFHVENAYVDWLDWWCNGLGWRGQKTQSIKGSNVWWEKSCNGRKMESWDFYEFGTFTTTILKAVLWDQLSFFSIYSESLKGLRQVPRVHQDHKIRQTKPCWFEESPNLDSSFFFPNTTSQIGWVVKKRKIKLRVTKINVAKVLFCE